MQSHSLEDGTFKSDHIKIGNRCTLETRSFTHYGVVMADYVVLRADAFLMKGDVFSRDFVESYIELKWEEVYNFEHTPHPVEFQMYYSV